MLTNSRVWRGGGPPNPKPICCWGSAWSSPWPPRACARWRAADPMRKPPGEKCEAALELLREPRLLAQPSTAFQVIPPVYRTNLQGALRVDFTRSPRRRSVTSICASLSLASFFASQSAAQSAPLIAVTKLRAPLRRGNPGERRAPRVLMDCPRNLKPGSLAMTALVPPKRNML